MPFDDFLRDEKDQATQPPSGALTPPKTDHGFGDFLQGLQATTTQTAQAGAVADAHGPVSADQAAQAAPLGRQLGLPQAVVETDIASHQAQAKAQSNAALLASNPVLASWVAANPDSARIAQDEYGKLSTIEKGWDYAGKLGYAALQLFAGGGNEALLGFNRLFQPYANLVGAGDWWHHTFLSGLEADKPAFELRPGATVGEKAAGAAGSFVSLMSQVIGSGGMTGAAKALPAAAGAVETLGHAAQTAGRAMAFPSLVAATNTGHDVYAQTLDPAVAAKAAVASYLATTAQGMVPFSAPGGPTVLGAMRRMATGALSGAATSEGQRAAMNLLMPPELQHGFSADEMIFQALSGAILGGAMGPRSADPHLYEAVRQTYTEALRAEQAERDVGKVAALGQIAAESKLREADPDAFHAFVKTVTDQSDLDAVWVDGKSLAAAYAQSGVRPPASVAEQLSEATSTSGDVRIPVADYATHIAGTDLEKAILPLMKAAPDGMTMAEGQSYFQKAAQTLTQRAQEIANKKQQADALAEDTETVHKSLGEELGRANRFPKAVNDLYASHLTNFFSTLAARKNIKPSEAMAAYPLHVTSALAHGGAQTLNQGRVTFEVAPDPRDTALTFKWDALPPQTKTDVSASIGKAVSEGALASLKDADDKPLKGQFEQHLGGWMDATNPSMSLVLDGKAEAYGPILARVLGHALNQQGMMYSSPEPFHGGHEMGAIRVEVGRDAAPEKVAAIYGKLRELKDDKGEPLVFGHTTADGQMVILNDGARIATEALGRLIDEHLGGAYTVESGTMYAEFPEKGNDDYGLSGQQHEAGASGAEPSLREAADQLRAEASRLLGDALAGVRAGPEGRVAPAGRAFAQGLPGRRQLPGGDGLLAEPGRAHQGLREADGSLRGLPRSVGGFSASAWSEAHRVAEGYMAAAGLPYDPPNTFVKVDPARAVRIADAFAAMAHDPENPEVKAAYDAMVRETAAQYQAILDSGLKVEFISGEDPYHGNPREMTEDVRNNHHMWVFSTRDGFGSDTTLDPKGNPLLAETAQQISGQTALANDLFRVVHDYFGHVKEDVGFRADGEENAWRAHMAMYSDLARKAATTETRGQNSWLNFGPYGEANRSAKVADTHFADQKTGLLPDWVVNEGRTDANVQTQSADFRDWFGDSKVVDQDGAPQVVYHGTAVDREGFERDSANGPGVYFSPRADVASEYAKMDGDAAHVVPVYLSLQNPKTLPLGESHNITAEQRDALEAQGYDGLIGVTKSGRVSEYVAFRPEQVKSAIGNRGTFDANDRRILYQNGQVPAFYSALARGVDSLPMKAGDANAWSQALKGLESRGVKREEIAWTGLEDWLKLQDGKVSKEQVAEFLRGNGVQVHETVLADTSMHVERMNAALDGTGIKAIYDSADEAISYEDRDGAAVDYAELPEQVKEIIDRVAAQGDGTFDVKAPAKYGQYTLPGGTNYREVLLTLPDTRTPQAKAVQATEEAAGGQIGFPESGGDYRSPHWEQPNVLAHFRVDDRTDADGRKVLFVHELQSDWGQQGKKTGFKKPGDRGITDAEFEEYRTLGRRTELSGPEQDRYDELAALNQSKASNALPAAPFVGKTEAWVSLALKRIIKMASDEGYQRVAFVNGEQSAERYDLSKQVSLVTVDRGINPNGEAGGFNIAAYDHADSSHPVIERRVTSESEAADLIGKEAASKLFADMGEGGHGELSGQSLKVGGEGMKAFYDKIVPNVAKDVLKKIGGEGLVKVDLGANRFAVYNTTEHKVVAKFLSREAAVEHIGDGPQAEYLEVRSAQQLGEVAEQTGFDITPAMKERAAGGFPLFQGGDAQRAQISFGHDITKDPSVVSLLQHADLSSFLHEGAHYFLEVYGDLAKKGEAFAQEDLGILRQWWADNANHILSVLDQDIGEATGAKKSQLEAERDAISAAGGAEFLKGHAATWSGGQDATSESRIATTLMHEYWARGYEKYMMEGKAPSPEMRGMFSRFRAWLLGVYRSLDALNVHLTPEVRGVMDRMLATDAAIKEAEALRSYGPLFENAKAAGMTVEQFNAHLAEGREATDAAVSELQARSLRDMKWLSGAKSQALKDLQRQAKAARDEVHAQVENEVRAYPAFQAQDYMREHAGKVDAEALKEWGERRDALTERAREAAKAELFATHPDVKGLQRGQLLARNKRTLDNQVEAAALEWEKANPKPKAGGFPDQDLVASRFGFDSADTMRRAIMEAGDRNDVIKALTDQRMMQEHGELTNQQSIEDAANEAVHNEARARFMATGLKALTKSPLPANQIMKAAKLAADTAIAAKRVGELRPDQYLAAEARANKEARAAAASDPATAIEAQRKAILNNQLARAAMAAKSEAVAMLDYFKRIGRESIRQKMDVDIREQIDDLLERFDLRQNPSGEPTRAEQNLKEWAQSQIDAGYAVNPPQELLNPAFRTHYKDMSVEQMRGLFDTVKAMEHLGRERRKVTIDGKQQDLDTVVNERLVPKLKERGQRFTQSELLDRAEDRHTNAIAIALDHFNSWRRGFAAMLKPQEFKRNQYDMHEILGPFGEVLFNPVIDANYAKVRMLKAMSEDFAKAGAELGRDWQDSLREPLSNTILADPDKGGMMSFNRGKLVGLLLHVGNESNLDKLARGWGWDKADVWRFVHESASEKDFQAAQMVGDMFAKHWPEIEAMNRRLGNTSPDRITPRPFMTQFGEQRGWFAPVTYDALRSRRGEREAAGQAINPGQALFGRDYFRNDTTTNGSLNSRLENYVDRVDLSFHSIPQKLQESIHDLAYREPLIDANKIIEHPEFRKAFREAYGREAYQSLRDWIANLVNSNNYDRQTGALGKFLQYTRTGMVINAIAFRASTVLKHGGSAGIKTLGYFVGGGEKYLASRMAQMGTDYRNQIAQAREKFGEINQRLMQQDRDFRATSASMFEPESAQAKGERFGHAAVAWSDMMTAVPTAWAAYDRAIAEGVPVSQGGTGHPMTEAQAVAYANKVVREAHGTTAEAARSMIMNNHSEAVKMFTTLYGFMNNSYGQQLDGIDKLGTSGISAAPVLARTFMAIIVPALWAGYLVHGTPADEESWAAWGAKAILGEVAASVPFVRDAYAMVEGFSHAGMVSAESWLASMVNAGKDIYHAAQGNEGGKPIRDILNAVGQGLHIPGLGQVGSSAQYVADVNAGKKTPEDDIAYAKGVALGH